MFIRKKPMLLSGLESIFDPYSKYSLKITQAFTSPKPKLAFAITFGRYEIVLRGIQVSDMISVISGWMSPQLTFPKMEAS